MSHPSFVRQKMDAEDKAWREYRYSVQESGDKIIAEVIRRKNEIIREMVIPHIGTPVPKNDIDIATVAMMKGMTFREMEPRDRTNPTALVLYDKNGEMLESRLFPRIIW